MAGAVPLLYSSRMATALPGFFITGTNTDVGKTYVAARIARSLCRQGYRVGVYKPVASGCQEREGELLSADALELWEAAGRPGDLAAVCPQRFAASLAPHLAARVAGQAIDARQLRTGLAAWLPRSDIVLVEGAGGLLSPVTDDEYVADLAHDFGWPLIVVAANVLGVINQTLQTLLTAAHFRDGLPVAGVILNDVSAASGADPSSHSNRSELEKRCGSRLLTQLGWQAEEFDPPVDWYELARRARGESQIT